MFDILDISGDVVICSHKVKDYILNDHSFAIDLFNISQKGVVSSEFCQAIIIPTDVGAVMTDKL